MWRFRQFRITGNSKQGASTNSTVVRPWPPSRVPQAGQCRSRAVVSTIRSRWSAASATVRMCRPGVPGRVSQLVQ
jgi:hypothetical protein